MFPDAILLRATVAATVVDAVAVEASGALIKLNF
jgi:hypothetical protein